MTTMYGIANCDTIKKAKKWLSEHNIAFDFHDYKKQAPDTEVLNKAIQTHGIETVLNKRGTTYRKLSDAEKENINESTVIQALSEHSSMIKRPILVHKQHILVGFNEAQYKECFNLD